MMFRVPTEDDKKEIICPIAVGSQDQLFSLWITNISSEAITSLKFFDKAITDLVWSHDGTYLALCSLDGTTAFINFDEDFGEPVTMNEVV
jgi:hypothetical protein